MGNSAASLRPEVLDDIAQRTEFSAEEVHAVYRRFRHECAGADSGLDLEHFERLYAQLFPHGDARRFAEHVFKRYDRDGNGRIDFRELLVCLSAQLKGTHAQRLGWIFELYDVDGSGNVSRQELLQMVASLQQLHGHILPKEESISADKFVDYIFEKADVDRDGCLSRDEFMQAAAVSTTMQSLIRGTLNATSSPFMSRRRLNKTHSDNNK